jgi:hypothetical protein
MACKCNGGLANTGIDNGCKEFFGATKGIILMNTYDSLGVRNSILSSSTIDSAFLTLKLNEVDKTKRWYPISKLEKAEITQAENVYEEAADRKLFVKSGVRSFAAELWQVSEDFAGKIDDIRCNETSAYLVDANGNIQGIISEDGTKLYPFRISQGSWTATYTQASESNNTLGKAMISFSFDRNDTSNSDYIRMITGVTTDILSATGLIDVTLIGLASPTVTATSFSISATIENGTVNPSKFTKILLADLVIKKGLVSVVPTAIINNNDGTYLVTIPSNVASTLSISILKTGFESNTIAIVTP